MHQAHVTMQNSKIQAYTFLFYRYDLVYAE